VHLFVELINQMSQDPNMNNASYPSQQPGNHDQNPPEKSSGDGQKDTLLQPPIVLLRPDLPKGQSFISFYDLNSFANLVTNSGYTGVPLYGKLLKNRYDFEGVGVGWVWVAVRVFSLSSPTPHPHPHPHPPCFKYIFIMEKLKL